MLRRGVPLVGGAAIPVHRRRTVLRNPGAGDIQAAEIELRGRVSLLGAGAQFVEVALCDERSSGHEQDACCQQSVTIAVRQSGGAERAPHRHLPVTIGEAPVTPRLP